MDPANPMDIREFHRKYVNSHTEIQGGSALAHPNGVPKRTEPGDKNAKNVKKFKKQIERRCMVERADKLQGYLHDLVDVRASDGLDRKQLPMKDLLKITVSALPKNLNINANVTNTFADLWNTIDAEGTVTSDD